MTARLLRYAEAVREALVECMAADPRVYVMGLGVPDPKGLFGSTLGLREEFGAARVRDMPTSENAMTGVAIGSSLVGSRPVLMHQRVEFSLLAMEQMVNQAAKWHYMFGGKTSVPLVIRLIIGRGWGQGPQHSQSLHSWFSHVPGLKVVMPSTAYDAKGMYVSAIEDDDPVVVLEHRWLHDTFGEVPEGRYRVALGTQRVARAGTDLTIAASSHMVVESLKAAQVLAEAGIEAEVIDVRSLAPFDASPIVESVHRTGHLLVADVDWSHVGFSAEILARVGEQAFGALRAPPRRVCLADCPTPTSRPLLELCYPRARHIAIEAAGLLGRAPDSLPMKPDLDPEHLDVPDARFRGPF